MNRKEMIVVGVIMLISFVGGAFGVPAVQQVFVTNFPSNEQVTVTNFPQPTSPTLQTTGVDIGLVAGPFVSASPVLVLASSTVHGNLTTAFSFSPSRGFVQVNTILLTLIYSGANANTNDQFSIQLNGDSPRVAPVSFTTGPLATIVKLQGTDLRVGSNVIELGIILAPGSVGSSLNIFELRLTVEYTFMV